MMQSGLSRELFENWCTDAKNGCIVAGYCVEGTLAKMILSEPEEITTMSGQKLPLKCQVNYISFSAHTDYLQTSAFIRALKPPHVILVHGEANEMNRLKSALIREYEGDPNTNIEFHNPRNTVAVELYFRGEKMAKVVGSLAMRKAEEGHQVSGILVKRNFNYHILAPNDLQTYTDMTMSTVTQRQSIYYSGSFQLLQYMVSQISGDVHTVESSAEKKIIRAFEAVDIVVEKRMVTLEWVASPINDMYADAVLAAVLQADSIDTPRYIPTSAKVDKIHFKECLIEMLQDMFGEESVPKTFSGDRMEVQVDAKKATIDISTLKVACDEDEVFEKIVQTACSKLWHSLMPVDAASSKTVSEDKKMSGAAM
jgi:cleavage and polyadenylation specificity factor subunit 3